MRANKRNKIESDNDREESRFKADNKKGKSCVEFNKNYNSKGLPEKEEPEENPFSFSIFLNNKENKAKSSSAEKIQKLENIIAEKDKVIDDLNKKYENSIKINDNMKKEFNDKIKLEICKYEQIIYENEILLNKIHNLEQKILDFSELNRKLTQNNNKNNNIINNNNLSLLSNDRYFQNNNNYNNNGNIGPNNYNSNYINLNINPQNEKKEIYIDSNINIIKKNENIQPIDQFNKPPLIGLQNIGATCFMNSTLQCFSQTKKLTNYFLNPKNRDKIINNNISLLFPNSYQLTPLYLDLIENLWKGNKTYFAPYNFMNTVNNMNPLFKRGEAGDAKDFIIFVLEQLHKELKRPLKNMKMLPVFDQPNQYDKKNTLNSFVNEFSKETSIISDLFFGFNETTTVCLNCKNYFNSRNSQNPICYNYGIFNLLIFPLEEVKNMINNQSLMNIQNFYQGPKNAVNIDDCFTYNQKTDYFTGENKNYCNICKQLSESYYTSRIYVCPDILILILNRGKGNIYKVKMNFNEVIDITNYVIQNENKRVIYNLYGVITHIGESGPNAHFVASCKSPVDGKWYRYNDAKVDPIQNFQKDIHDFCSPYILFYEKNR